MSPYEPPWTTRRKADGGVAWAQVTDVDGFVLFVYTGQSPPPATHEAKLRRYYSSKNQHRTLLCTISS